MKGKTILFIATFIVIGAIVNGQTIAKYDSVVGNEKARCQQEKLDGFLAKNVKYTKEAVSNGIQGDVILSFVVNKNGRIDSLSIDSSPDIVLSTSSIVAFNAIAGDWIPAKINNVPVDKRYLIVFRYRIYLDTRPFDYKATADKFFEKQKNEKALKFYDEGIKDNPYNHQLFESRAKVKKMLGDMEGAKLDHSLATVMDDKIISIVDITAIGTSCVVRTVTTTTMGQPIRRY